MLNGTAKALGFFANDRKCHTGTCFADINVTVYDSTRPCARYVRYVGTLFHLHSTNLL